MAVTLTKDLTTICAGFGDMKIKFSKGIGDVAQEVSVSYEGMTYTASFFNRTAVIDLHGKGLTLLDIEYTSPGHNTPLTVYKNELLVGLFSNDETLKVYYPLNMSQQIGQNNNFSVDKIHLCKYIRTNLKKIKRYNGYERRVAFLCIPSVYGAGYGQAYITIDGVAKGNVTHSQGTYPLFLLDASVANSTIEIVNNSISDSLQVEVLEAPEHPFYVRWVNAMAGWDYWMFDCRYVKKRKTGSRKMVERYVTDMAATSGNKQTISLEVNEEVTVGASQISEDEFECISALLYSTFVQWYDESKGKWIDIIPDGEASFFYGSPKTDIEITFILPERQLQMI
jgi:hypothetical protein